MKKDKNYKLPSDFGVQFLQDFCDDSWNQAYEEERMEKFKFGPLIIMECGRKMNQVITTGLESSL